jgi:phosphoglycerate dehydrogenase-like enzyme
MALPILQVFVADDVNEDDLAPLRNAGITVTKETDLDEAALADRIRQVDGLIVRSATMITAELIDKAERLRVIGCAGVSVDNIDVMAATVRGIVVTYAHDGNMITTAQQMRDYLLHGTLRGAVNAPGDSRPKGSD